MFYAVALGAHESCASLVQSEMECWEKQKFTSSIVATVYAVSTRVFAAFALSVWSLAEIVCLVPNTIFTTLQLLKLEEAGFNKPFFQQAIRVYWVVIRALLAEVLVFAGGIVAPEIIYGKYELHKWLFYVKLEGFLETMPNFPEVDRKILQNSPEFKDLALTWAHLGLDSQLWKNSVSRACVRSFEGGNVSGSRLLNSASPDLQQPFFLEVIRHLAESLNLRQEEGSLTPAMLSHCTPFVFITLFNQLTTQTQQEILRLVPEVEIAVENDSVPFLFERLMGYRFRSPNTTALGHLLLQEMKNARDDLVKQKIYAAEAIECYGSSFAAIVSIGILRFIQNARIIKSVPHSISFGMNPDLEIVIRRDQQFFGAKRYVEEGIEVIQELNVVQKQALFERLSFSPEDVIKAKGKLSPHYNDPLVTNCFLLIGKFKTEVIEPKIMKNEGLRGADQIPWHEAFVV